MTQEDKELLLKDLCSRLPYKVRGKDCDGNTREMVVIYPTGTIIARTLDDKSCAGCGFIPYLRPMHSMTEEERKELAVVCGIDYIDSKIIDFGEFLCEGSPVNIEKIYGLLEYLNAHHFDYRGLIEKGLAIDCTNLNIY